MKKAAFLLVLAAAGCSSAVADRRSSDPYERYLGALAMGAMRDPIDVNRLLGQLKDPDPLARSGAVVALGEIGDPAHASAVVETMAAAVPKDLKPEEREPAANVHVRLDAVIALSRMGGEVAQAAVLQAARKDVSADVRRAAVLATPKFGERREVLAALVDALGDPSAGVVFGAYRLLMQISHRSDLPRAKEPWRAWLETLPK